MEMTPRHWQRTDRLTNHRWISSGVGWHRQADEPYCLMMSKCERPQSSSIPSVQTSGIQNAAMRHKFFLSSDPWSPLLHRQKSKLIHIRSPVCHPFTFCCRRRSSPPPSVDELMRLPAVSTASHERRILRRCSCSCGSMPLSGYPCNIRRCFSSSSRVTDGGLCSWPLAGEGRWRVRSESLLHLSLGLHLMPGRRQQ